MAYTSNPYAGKARRLAVNDVLYGRCTKAQAGRKYGVDRATIGKWMSRAHPDHRVFLHTIPSRPRHHPNELKSEVVERVVTLRKQTNRCAQILHVMLGGEGVSISLSSVKRILKRYNLLRRKKRKIKGDTRFKRPHADKPGALVQIGYHPFRKSHL
ncbi:MAG TPA: leucine zipper domain-containing protein [Candidatus Saccharimonadales bacterium]|nr:leucine zipper domain-containing protein [Candidatus Saccharimonadales bacterium]